jgi:hypothetical protein
MIGEYSPLIDSLRLQKAGVPGQRGQWQPCDPLQWVYTALYPRGLWAAEGKEFEMNKVERDEEWSKDRSWAASYCIRSEFFNIGTNLVRTEFCESYFVAEFLY